MSLRDKLIEAVAHKMIDHADHYMNQGRTADHKGHASVVLDAMLDTLEANADEWANAAWNLHGREHVADLLAVLREGEQ